MTDQVKKIVAMLEKKKVWDFESIYLALKNISLLSTSTA